jgi:hypothetical protein
MEFLFWTNDFPHWMAIEYIPTTAQTGDLDPNNLGKTVNYISLPKMKFPRSQEACLSHICPSKASHRARLGKHCGMNNN